MRSRKPRPQQSTKSAHSASGQHRGGPRVPPAAAPAAANVLFEDQDLLVALKPAGLATANVPRGEQSLLTCLRELLESRGGGATSAENQGFLGVVSRLDQPVSGVVVVARSREAAASLSAQFRERTVEKTYHALVEGRFPGPIDETRIWNDLLERPSSGPADNATPHSPQEAVVEARLLARGVEVSLVELRPTTGRRHQLRVQLGSRKCPIVGDRLYGSRLPFPCGIALHSSVLRIDHPSTGQRLSFRSPWPESWQQAARGLVLPDLAAFP
jgi:23S rRNA pseudouridine1911/1915/1917 synthase